MEMTVHDSGSLPLTRGKLEGLLILQTEWNRAR